jgi:catechol 2,3-dioxygenase-like lactoylglutathione lyase family enzyme
LSAAQAEENRMPATAMDHFTVLTDRLEDTVSFYQDLLGLEPGDRPEFRFPGAWMYCGGRAVLHLVAGRSLPDDPRGVLDHMAFAATGLAQTVSKLQARGLEHDLRQLPGSGLWQLFFNDPNGARVELDFAASEAAPAGWMPA